MAANRTIISSLLQHNGFQVILAENGRYALELLKSTQPDLILLDVMMPELDGFETCRRIKADPLTKDIPVIFMTALSATEDKLKGFNAGAVDYITRPLSQRELVARITTHLKNTILTRSFRQHANYLETSSQLSRQITSILDIDVLLHEATKLIQSRFGYYLAGIWLPADDDILILKAAAGREKQTPRLSGHQLSISGSPGIIATVWRTGRAYLSTDIRSDDVYVPNSLLPDTLSEFTLPLQVGEETVGILDMQGDALSAFGEEDLIILEMMGSQLSIAIQNAQSYAQLACFNAQLEQEVQKRTEDLQTAYTRLERLDQAKSDFINVASHELFTPIALINGYSQILTTDVTFPEDSSQAKMLRGINKGAQRLHDVVQSMLDVAKIDNEQFQLFYRKTSLGAIFQQIKFSLEPALSERRITLCLESSLDALPTIDTDPEAIYKALQQLILNAIKYTPDGGQIEVNGRSPTPNSLEITVKDSGIGIDPANHDLIFTKFYQTGQVDLHSTGKTKFKGGGPGLGLAIVKGIIEAHGGQIRVESAGYNEQTCPGSAFHVCLPKTKPQPEQ